MRGCEMLTAPERSSHCKCSIQMKYLVLRGHGPMGEHLAGSQTEAGNMEFVGERDGKGTHSLNNNSLFPGCCSSTGRQEALAEQPCCGFARIRTSSLKMGLICCFYGEKITFDTDRTIQKKHSEESPLFSFFPQIVQRTEIYYHRSLLFGQKM